VIEWHPRLLSEALLTDPRFRHTKQNRAIWEVGLPVFPPASLPGLLVPARLVGHAPAAARALYSGPQLAA